LTPLAVWMWIQWLQTGHFTSSAFNHSLLSSYQCKATATRTCSTKDGQKVTKLGGMQSNFCCCVKIIMALIFLTTTNSLTN